MLPQPLKVLSMSADGDLIIQDDAELNAACPYQLPEEFTKELAQWREAFPRPQPVAPDADMQEQPRPTTAADGAAGIDAATKHLNMAGTLKINLDVVQSDLNESVVAKSELPATDPKGMSRQVVWIQNSEDTHTVCGFTTVQTRM